MSGAPSAFPLAWPAGKARTPASQRKRPTFTQTGAGGKAKPVSRQEAAARIEIEIERLGGIYPMISTNVQMTLSGRPHGGAAEPLDPGVCVYFSLKGQPYAMACDTFNTLAGNLGAIAAHIKASRAIESYGVASAAETLQAFQALPSGSAPREWWNILGVAPDASLEAINAAYRVMAVVRHPDQGGSDLAMAELNAARDAGRKACAA